MVKKEINFSDGTRIFYEEENGTLHRFIEYAYSPQEKQQLRDKPFLKDLLEKQVRKYNAGKYYYLKILEGIIHGLDYNQKCQLDSELKALCERTGTNYDSNIVNKNFLHTFGKYWRGNNIQCAAFFVTIYLAMLDLEEIKMHNPRYGGKKMVLASCQAILFLGLSADEAATMFDKKKQTVSNDYDDDCFDGYDSRYEKYNGYNGYDDDTIDDAFDGFPEATWNVD